MRIEIKGKTAELWAILRKRALDDDPNLTDDEILFEILDWHVMNDDEIRVKLGLD
jgi:hypothetical protein